MVYGSSKWRFIAAGIFLLAFIVVNAIPSAKVRQTPDQNVQANNSICTVQNWGWPFHTYSRYGGGGYVSPMEMLPWDVTPIYSKWHIFGLVLNVIVAITGVALLQWVRMPGLPGEGQEDIPIVRDSEREDDSSLMRFHSGDDGHGQTI
jgi:hypothetical protein